MYAGERMVQGSYSEDNTWGKLRCMLTARMSAMPASTVRFLKGHGTENDFVVVIDPDAKLPLTQRDIRRIANQHTGLGGDGVIRIVKAGELLARGLLADLPEGVLADEWFMDYRNADGSVAQMCGNGVRVCAHALVSEGLLDVEIGQSFGVGTRAGRREVIVHEATALEALVSCQMGQPKVMGVSTVWQAGSAYEGLGVDVGNPHLAVVIPGLDEVSLKQLPVDQPVEWDREFFPEGVNVEMLTPLVDGQVHMRVHERGVGETRSCGTGTVAAAVAALADAGHSTGEVTVHVPGGHVDVRIGEGFSVLRGPSRIIAVGTLFIEAG